MNTSTLSEKAVRIACAEDGTLATKGSRTWGQRIGVYLAALGLKQPNDYCAAFVYWSFEQAAKQLGRKNPVPKTGSVPRMYSLAEASGLLVNGSPQRGDVYITADHGHTGIVEVTPSVEKLNKCCTIEGNTWIGDHLWGVHRRTKNLSNAVFVRFV